MKTKLLLVNMFIIMLLVGCGRKDNYQPLVNGVDVNDYKEREESALMIEAQSYEIGNLFLEYKSSIDYSASSDWYFSGFIGENTFVISKVEFPGYNGSICIDFFIPLKTGYVFNLSGTGKELRLVNYDIENGIVTLKEVID